MIDESVIRDRLALLPPIRRARLWRLYAENGQRFLDFWMDGGRSMLGAKGTGIGTAAKAAVDVGLTRPFPSVHAARLEKDLLARYSGFAAARFFRNEERAVAAAAALAPAGESLSVLMPFAEFYRGGPARLEGAMATPTEAAIAAPDVATPSAAAIAAPRVATPRLPCPAALAPGVLLFRSDEAAAATLGDIVPPLVLVCAHRALHEFDRFVVEYSEALWRRSDRRLRPFFERSGPYLYPKTGAKDYGQFFAAALGAGVILSPVPELPSILPGDFDDGELARLAKALG